MRTMSFFTTALVKQSLVTAAAYIVIEKSVPLIARAAVAAGTAIKDGAVNAMHEARARRLARAIEVSVNVDDEESIRRRAAEILAERAERQALNEAELRAIRERRVG